MAYWVVGRNGDTKSYMCDTTADIAKLPTRLHRGADQEGIDRTDGNTTNAGSDATVISPAAVYMLSYDGDEWKKL